VNLLCTFSSLYLIYKRLVPNNRTVFEYRTYIYVLKAAVKDEIFLDSKHRRIELAFLCALTHNNIRYMSREFKFRVYSYLTDTRTAFCFTK